MAILKQAEPGNWWCNVRGPRFAAYLCIIGLMIAGAVPVRAEEPLPSEYQVKAAFLVNFPKYVDWPPEAFADANSPIVIAVAGESKVSDEIEKVIAGRTINGRAITLKRVMSGADPGICQILFIPAAESRRVPNISPRIKDGAVLTVGESDDFLDEGGIINLAHRDRKIGLEVSLIAAAHARIKISSKLLSVAGVVKGKSN